MYSSRLFFEKKRTNFFFIYLFLPFLVVCVCHLTRAAEECRFFVCSRRLLFSARLARQKQKVLISWWISNGEGSLAKMFLLDFLSDALGFFRSSLHRALSYPPNLIARLLAFPDDTLTMQKSKILFFLSFVCVGVTAWHWSLDQPDPTDQFLPEFRLLSPVFHAEFFVSSCALLGFIRRVA